MINKFSILKNEKGSALIIALIIMTLLTLLGIAATTTSTIETQISSNDRLYKMAFYNADGGVETSKELLEQNIEQRGFPGSNVGGIGIYKLDFFLNPPIRNNIPSDKDDNDYTDDDDDDGRDISIPETLSFGDPGYNNPKSPPHTNILIGGNTSLSTGNALQMIAGYEGKGKGAAGGGGHVVYDIRSRREGIKNARATIKGRWRHVI